MPALLARRWRALVRFWRDPRGNVLVLTAAMMIPLVAVIGSGVDVARAHLAKSRMQQACDAASLAGRWKASAGGDTTAINDEAVKYFTFDFPQQTYGTASFTPAVSVTGSTAKVVTVTADTTIPMTIMRMFGYATVPISVTCTAKQDYVNTDVVLVLDTTGSMAACTDGSDCNSNANSKIAGLRSAVLALYDQLAPVQTQLAAAGMRLRYGIVPYSSTVDVGKLLYAKNTGYVRMTSPYMKCQRSGWYGCTVRQVSVTHAASDVASWNGCIEERHTSSAVTSTTNSVPSDAYDMMVDMVPTDDVETQWPWQDTTNGNTGVSAPCPVEAVRLKTWTRSDLSTYLDTLTASGNTYHDVGMVWGGRFISASGVFGDSPTTFANMPVNKYVIFMTDGLMEPAYTVYSAWGVERYDQRVTGGSLGEDKARHIQRFNLICSGVKNVGASIWVVAFASALDSNLTNCASNPNQASVSGSSADLIARFAEIGKNIGALRLTQ